MGLIATVRRILVVTLQNSDPAQSKSAAEAATSFSHTMIELGVLSALTLVLIISIYIARRSNAFGEA